MEYSDLLELKEHQRLEKSIVKQKKDPLVIMELRRANYQKLSSASSLLVEDQKKGKNNSIANGR